MSEKEIKINDNICILNNKYYNNDGIYVSNITKTTCISEEENILFPKGEQRYELNKDSNESILIGPIKKNFRTKLLLSFSLDNITNPKDKHSFGISIINNKYIGNKTFLGKLENKKGENIEYDKLFEIDYIFESEQIIIIEPIINDIKMEIKKKLTVYTLIAKKNYELLIENIGTLKINYTKIEKNIKFNTELSKFNFSIILNNGTIFNSKESLEDIFFVIRNIKDGKKKRPTYKSREYNFKLDELQKIPPIIIEADSLCNDYDMPIYFELYSPSINPSKNIGSFDFTLNNLKKNYVEDEFEQHEIKSNNKNIGTIGKVQIRYEPKKYIDVEEFISKNGQIHLEIGIDYTKSNINRNEPLHFISDKEETDYEKAIKSCGEIIALYDYDKKYPVYGFGAILNENEEEANHCFNINFKDDPNIIGINSIIDFYKESLKKVEFSGPTNFSPIIKKVIKSINDDLKNKPEENHYYILMILTDGIITDMEDTIDNIVKASNLPLSIIIIGIGDSDFSGMEILDGDEIQLEDSKGKKRERDIVQFVEFNRFKNKNGINDNYENELAQEVLKEIPRQIEEYYYFCGKFNE